MVNAMLPMGSPRLWLRKLATGDLASFMGYRNDPEVARFQSWEGISQDEAVTFIEEQASRDQMTPGQWLQIALEVKATGQLAGDCALRIHADDPRQATIGITLAQSFQGQGYAREALSTLLDFLFAHLMLRRVQADTDPRNTSAYRLLERLGMRREAHHKRSVWFKAEWTDEYIYGVSAEDWMKQRGIRSGIGAKG